MTDKLGSPNNSVDFPMSQSVVLLSIPALRQQDLISMPRLHALAKAGEQAALNFGFPSVTWPAQASMLTGRRADSHGVVANGFYWREEDRVEMWTAWNEKIQAPQIWDRLHEHDRSLTSAVWFPMLSKGCGADFVCMPAPVHNPDGSESLWCYTKPVELYGELRDTLDHFPLQHFWGPMANIRSTDWIADSAVAAAGRFRPRLFYIYLPHLDYAAQRDGPDSPEARAALSELDEAIGRLIDGFQTAYGSSSLLWLAVSEYTISPVDHVTYPNRELRAAGLLEVRQEEDGEHLDTAQSDAWALVDHQFSHVFVKDRDPTYIDMVMDVFRELPGIDEVLVGVGRQKYQLDHERSGDVVLISSPNSWQSYYWWEDDEQAPAFARSVDIHRKPGYDPVELFFDAETKSIPLDASLVRGSHGVPSGDGSEPGVIISSLTGVLPDAQVNDCDVFGIVLKQFGIEA